MSTYTRSMENLDAVRRLDQLRARVEASAGEPDVSDVFEIEVDGVKHDVVIRSRPSDTHVFDHPVLEHLKAAARPWDIRS